jgi:hypothetical protein
MYSTKAGVPVSPLVEHLVETFFAQLGCNFPFLYEGRFLPLLKKKQVEPVLVHAICALTARFTAHPLLTRLYTSSAENKCNNMKPYHGHIFADKAKYGIIDAFPAPTLASIQAALLLAYEGFGRGQDSTLWMFLGCAIRMVQDLGLHKMEGVIRADDTPPESANDGITVESSHNSTNHTSPESVTSIPATTLSRERINTFWSVLMLDRVISSGTGRPVTLRDDDIELPFPSASVLHSSPSMGNASLPPSLPGLSISGAEPWPDPFPALIRILHIYGRVTDTLNQVHTEPIRSHLASLHLIACD